jgi:hypothetical protein
MPRTFLFYIYSSENNTVCVLVVASSCANPAKYTGTPGLQKNKQKFTKVGNENYTKEAETIHTDILKPGLLCYNTWSGSRSLRKEPKDLTL